MLYRLRSGLHPRHKTDISRIRRVLPLADIMADWPVVSVLSQLKGSLCPSRSASPAPPEEEEDEEEARAFFELFHEDDAV